MPFQVPATIESISTRKDRTMKVIIGTQELEPKDSAELMSLHNTLGWFMFAENAFEVKDIPKENAPEFKDDKSPSQRLRAILWVYWDTCTNKSTTFNSFYDQFVEKKIKEIKELLPKK